MGEVCVRNWEQAHSIWGRHFKLIVNTSDEQGQYPRRNVGVWAELGSRRRGVAKSSLHFDDFLLAVSRTLRMLSNGKGVLVHCRQGKHRSGAFLCFILALILEESLAERLDKYLKADFLPHDRRCLMQVLQIMSRV